MTREEQRQFIVDLIGNVKDSILNAFDSIPEDWDGCELRWLIAERYNDVVWGDKQAKKGRKRRYNNYMYQHPELYH